MQVKLLNWNIWYKEKKEKFASIIKKVSPDIVCLQEIINTKKVDTAKYLADYLGYNYFFKEAETWDTRPEVVAQGNCILSRFPITDTSYFFIQDQKHNPANAFTEGRIYLEAELKIGHVSLNVGTVHFSFGKDFTIDTRRKKEIDKLESIIQSKAKRYILTGDFNSLPDSYPIKLIRKYLRNAGPGLDQNTWTTRPFKYKEFNAEGLHWRIDYVFVTRDIKVISSEILTVDASDHLPILTTVEL